MEQKKLNEEIESFDELPSRLDRRRKRKAKNRTEGEEERKERNQDFIMTNVILWAFIAMVAVIIIFFLMTF